MFEYEIREENGYHIGIVRLNGIAIDRIQTPVRPNSPFTSEDLLKYVEQEFARLVRFRLHGMDRTTMDSLKALDPVTWSDENRGT